MSCTATYLIIRNWMLIALKMIQNDTVFQSVFQAANTRNPIPRWRLSIAFRFDCSFGRRPTYFMNLLAGGVACICIVIVPSGLQTDSRSYAKAKSVETTSSHWRHCHWTVKPWFCISNNRNIMCNVNCKYRDDFRVFYIVSNDY